MKSFNSLVDQSTRTAISNNRQIKELISQIVPSATLSHIEFCRLEGGRLRVTLDSAAWVAKLRFSERQLVDTLRAAGLDAHTVSFHVSPEEKPVLRTTSRKANQASTRSADSLMQAAAAVGSSDEDDDSLRHELLRLAAKLRAQ
ncbi:MAG: DciA family protein [Granulosicoccus sp.]